MKTATLEKKAIAGKAKHPHELPRRIQKGLRFSELETLQNSMEMPFEQLAAKLSISRSTLQRRKAIGRKRRLARGKWTICSGGSITAFTPKHDGVGLADCARESRTHGIYRRRSVAIWRPLEFTRSARGLCKRTPIHRCPGGLRESRAVHP